MAKRVNSFFQALRGFWWVAQTSICGKVSFPSFRYITVLKYSGFLKPRASLLADLITEFIPSSTALVSLWSK